MESDGRAEKVPPPVAAAAWLERGVAVGVAESVAAALPVKGAEQEACPLAAAVKEASSEAATERVALGLVGEV